MKVDGFQLTAEDEAEWRRPLQLFALVSPMQANAQQAVKIPLVAVLLSAFPLPDPALQQFRLGLRDQGPWADNPAITAAQGRSAHRMTRMTRDAMEAPVLDVGCGVLGKRKGLAAPAPALTLAVSGCEAGFEPATFAL